MNTNNPDPRPAMQTFVILRRGAWPTHGALEKSGETSARIGDEEMSDKVRWIRSYVTEEDGKVGTVCIYQGVDEAAIREHADRAGMVAQAVIPVSDTLVVRPDPA